MFLDTNVRYSLEPPKPLEPGEAKPKPALPFMCPTGVATADQRVGLAFRHMANISERFISTIVQIAKMIFFSILVCLSFGQSKEIQEELRDSGRRFVLATAGMGISFVGFFAPYNAMEWQANLYMYMYEGKKLEVAQARAAVSYI